MTLGKALKEYLATRDKLHKEYMAQMEAWAKTVNELIKDLK